MFICRWFSFLFAALKIAFYLVFCSFTLMSLSIAFPPACCLLAFLDSRIGVIYSIDSLHFLSLVVLLGECYTYSLYYPCLLMSLLWLHLSIWEAFQMFFLDLSSSSWSIIHLCPNVIYSPNEFLFKVWGSFFKKIFIYLFGCSGS